MKDGKTIIGVLGENGSGKDTVVGFLIEKFEEDKVVSHFRFSDILKETLQLWGIPINRKNLQALPVCMDETFGEGALTRALRGRVEKDSADLVIINGARWRTDRDFIRSLDNNLLVYVTAPAKTRFDRMVARGEKKGEKDMDFDKFLHEEGAKAESFIKEIGEGADFKIENTGTIDDLRAKVDEFCDKNLSS